MANYQSLRIFILPLAISKINKKTSKMASKNQHEIQALLDESRGQLLDFSSRNRLISLPLGSKNAKIVQVYDEVGPLVFKTLVVEKKQMTFVHGQLLGETNVDADYEDDENLVGLPQPDEEKDNTGSYKRHTDTKLQTKLSSEKLQRRLFDLHYEALSLIEEQGVNVLYLSIGVLNWVETTGDKKTRSAPLVLVPVDLSRKNSGDKFTLRYREEEITDNLCLIEKMKKEFNLTLPSLVVSEEDDSLNLEKYFLSCKQSISDKIGWSVDANVICLGFFSFSKFLMYKDLDANNWKDNNLLDKPLIRQLIGAEEGIELNGSTDQQNWSDIIDLDQVIPADQLDHVVDADSSQTIAVQMVREGRNLVIQGPPGTGKSQTITNIIATAVLDGKKVLFLAEKLAALEVVQRRLVEQNLGVMCLELHSSKAKKSVVMDNLKRTWDLGKPNTQVVGSDIDRLDEARANLRVHIDTLHHDYNLPNSAYHYVGLMAGLGNGPEPEQLLQIDGIESWNADKLARAAELLDLYVQQLFEIKHPSTNIWRGVELTTYIGTEDALYKMQISEAATSLEALRQELGQFAKTIASLSMDFAGFTLQNIDELLVLIDHIIAKPTGLALDLSKEEWDLTLDHIIKVTEVKQTFEAFVSKHKQTYVDGAWAASAERLRPTIMQYGDKWYNFFVSDYRAAKRELQTYLRIPLARSYSDKITVLDTLIQGQGYYHDHSANKAIGEHIFGIHWASGGADQLMGLISWVQELHRLGVKGKKRHQAWTLDHDNLVAATAKLRKAVADFNQKIGVVNAQLKINWAAYSEGQDAPSIEETCNLLKRWQDGIADLAGWIKYADNHTKCKALGLLPILDFELKHLYPAQSLILAFERLAARSALRHARVVEPKLARFDGNEHNKKVETFRKIDHGRKLQAMARVLAMHHANYPVRMAGGANGVLQGEVNKVRNIKPIRKLLELAGPAVQALKPVFMMSPLSVAQFLAPDVLDFDLLVIDEASQIKPVDALGAIARSKQIVVVGDDKQLPPTSFFSKMTSEGPTDQEDDEDAVVLDQVKAAELESILTLCMARSVNKTMLNWHYRSKHQSLIAVSNKQYYESKLNIVPSPYHAGALMGVRYNFVQGVYERGKGQSTTNPIEALTVAKAVLQHAETTPNQSLLVAAFSQKQQRAIQDQIEILRRHNPALEDFLGMHPNEPFTVKNLENVQGDERDVVFLSIGYGRDSEGKITMNFGPLGKEGGERRLNVLISRAKVRCEVFTNLSFRDINLTSIKSKGLEGLKMYLEFAEQGSLSASTADQRPDNEAFVAALKSDIESTLGYQVVTQVGESGFFVDLAILDNDKKGRFVLGIECDGTSYFRSPSARDRDRLRQSVLESKGWILHRVWSLEYLKNKAVELQRIKTAFEAALQLITEHEAEVVRPVIKETKVVVEVQREVVGKAGDKLPCQGIYEMVRLKPEVYPNINDVPKAKIVDMVIKTIEKESPIHTDEVVTRVREALGFKAAGATIREVIQNAIRAARSKAMFNSDGSFHSVAEVLIVRDRSNDKKLLKIEYIAPAEIDLAIREYTKVAYGCSADELAKGVSKMLGFSNMSEITKSGINTRINYLQNASVLEVDPSGRLKLR